MAGSIKAVLDTPLLTNDGELTDESEKLIDDIAQDHRLDGVRETAKNALSNN